MTRHGQVRPDHDPPRRSDPGDVLYQMYTSGTTGRPKGVLLTHRSVLTNCAQVSCGLGYAIEPGDRWLIVAPLFHAAAVITAFNCVFGGGCLVIHRGFDPAAVVNALASEDIALTTLVPAMIQACLGVPGVAERTYPRLRAIAYGGSVIGEEALRRAIDVFGCDFYQGFGQTESSAGLTYLTELDHRAALAELRRRRRIDRGEEAARGDGEDLFVRELSGERAADELRTASRD